MVQASAAYFRLGLTAEAFNTALLALHHLAHIPQLPHHHHNDLAPPGEMKDGEGSDSDSSVSQSGGGDGGGGAQGKTQGRGLYTVYSGVGMSPLTRKPSAAVSGPYPRAYPHSHPHAHMHRGWAYAATLCSSVLTVMSSLVHSARRDIQCLRDSRER